MLARVSNGERSAYFKERSSAPTYRRSGPCVTIGLFSRATISSSSVSAVSLITYGPGPYNQCNVRLNLKPMGNAADQILREVNALVPAGPRR